MKIRDLNDSEASKINKALSLHKAYFKDTIKMEQRIWEYNSILKLYNYSKANEWMGYDPYDGLNSNFTKQISETNKLLGLFIIQFNKNSIINFRKFLKINKALDIKGSGLLASALFKLFRLTGDEKYLNDAYYLLDFLLSTSLKKYFSEHCWQSHNFIVQFPGRESKPTDPSTIGTVSCAFAFLDDYITTGNKKSLEIVKSAINFLIDNFYVESNDKCFFKYYSKSKPNHIIYNASTHAVMLLSNTYKYMKNKEILEISKKVMDYIISKQKSDGAWYYSENNGIERIQIDFHQGFMLDAFYDFIKYTNPDDKKYINALMKGSEFYKNEQFLSDGRCKWRYPRLWPVDIHNQAQGIITFSKLSNIKSEYLEFAKTIAKWTINNMQDKIGYFYYQKWPFFTNKIPYMRWGQSWMMLALSTLMSVEYDSQIIN